MFKNKPYLKILLAGIGSLFIIGGGYFGFTKYENYQGERTRIRNEEITRQNAEAAYKKCIEKATSPDLKYESEWINESMTKKEAKIINWEPFFIDWIMEKYPEICAEYGNDLIKDVATRKIDAFAKLPKLTPLPGQSEYLQGLDELGKENWQTAKEILSKVPENTFFYQRAKELIVEADKKITEALAKEISNLKQRLSQKTAPNPSINITTIPENSASNYAGYIAKIICSDGSSQNPKIIAGSGTIFGLNRFVITNSHVVEGSVLCTIGITDDVKQPPSRWYQAIIDTNVTALDIATLKPLEPLPSTINTVAYNLCPSSEIKIGDKVTILGYPTLGGNTITVTDGVISGFDGFLIKTSAKIEYGNSGGGAFLNKNNCWFGIPTFVTQGELESLGYIVNFSLIHEKAADK